MLRNHAFDNAKLLMITLVVFGHLIEPLIKDNIIIKSIYIFIYSFHMPVFIIMAGALSTTEISEKRIVKYIKMLLIPLLAFTILYESPFLLTGRGISSYTSNWQPYWILWFLFSMFIWKITLPIIMNFRFPLLLSIATSLCAGYVDDVGYFLGVSRTLYFFPFFILGYKLGSDFLLKKELLKLPKLLYFSIILINFTIFYLLKDLPHQWMLGSVSYEKINGSEWYSFIIRTSIYVISCTTSIAIMMLIPNKESILSTRGGNSLFVYVWHGFFIHFLSIIGILQFLIDKPTALSLAILFIFSILITALLSANFVAKLTTKLLLIPLQKLLLIKHQH